MSPAMFSVIANTLVVAGVFILLASLSPLRQLTRQLPPRISAQ
ncbi:MAG: hypothetical protein ACSLE5_07675 [Porticoccaceae bacterium]